MTHKQARRGIKTFALQEKLPRLPIPKLEDTVKKYVKSIQPLASKEEYKQVCVKAKEFLEKEGPILQKRLEEYDKTQMDLWLHKAYLEWREPVMNNVNWYMLFKDCNRYGSSMMKVAKNLPFTDFQLDRAAFIVRGALEYNRLLEEEILEPEQTKFGPLCMHQNKRLFGITRVPSFPFDRLVERPKSRHIMVLVKEQVFHVQVRDDVGNIFDEATVKKSLEECIAKVKDAKFIASPPICSFTTENRDVWAAIREKIISAFPRENGESFEKVNDTLFAVSLEDMDPKNDDREPAKVSLHGFAGRNRWFDKCINFWVCPGGKAGGNGEHSPCDAVIPNLMAQFVLDAEAKNVKFTGLASPSKVQHLEFKVTPEIMEALMGARVTAAKACDAIDLIETRFKEFGAEVIRGKLGVGPDGFLQAAMQLAYFRLNGEMTATYETASTRQFLHGRTETIRACTSESRAMCEAFDKKGVPLLKKVELVKSYLESHKQYLIQASNGQGVDRHFLGLRSMLKEGEALPALFDAVYWRSLNFNLSTSNVSPGEIYDGLGFGPATDAGYGINYSLAPENIRFSVSSRRTKERKHDSQGMRDAITKSLKDVFATLAAAPKSKL